MNNLVLRKFGPRLTKALVMFALWCCWPFRSIGW